MDAAAGRERWHAIDHLKAAAILAVVATHAGRVGLGSWGSPLDFALTSLWTRFHVPSFLFASGFLYAGSAAHGPGELGRRLARIGVPYLVASGVALLVGLAVGAAEAPGLRWPTPVRGAADVLWQLGTASALGVYYYVLLAALCIPFAWPLSRRGAKGAAALCAACAALALAFDAQPAWRPSSWLARRLGGDAVFWALRDPLEGFSLGFFAAGWLAALRVAQLAQLAARRAALCAGLCAAGVALAWGSFAGFSPLSLGSFDRVVYTFSVAGLVALATRARPAGPALRFLADASLALYLFHRIFQLLAQPLTDPWPALPRIAGQLVAGLGGAALVAWGGRRCLGAARARRWLGA
jgi:fucose 4-O-acetylase-like acetyltransferase